MILHPGKETEGRRLTYLLRSNSTRPIPSSLDTPPATDASDFHVSDANISDSNITDDPNDTDDEPVAADRSQSALSVISEFPSPSRPSSPTRSVVDEPYLDIDSAEEADVDQALTASIESFSLAESFHRPDEIVYPGTLLDSTRPSTRYSRPRQLLPTYPRSTSSPSPVRRSSHRRGKFGRRGKGKIAKNHITAIGGKGLFYDYLFAPSS